MPNIKYHPDVRGYAVNVKTLHMHFADGGTEVQREFAWDTLNEAWWDAANEIAKEEGFVGAAACGRSFGWCAPFYTYRAGGMDFTSYVDDDSEERLEQFNKFAKRIEALLAEAPVMYKETLEQVIKDDAAREGKAKREADELKEMQVKTLGLLRFYRAEKTEAYWRKQWGILE